jgi:hypothetical protein
MDIVLKERLTLKILTNIRLNKDDLYKSGSDEDIFHALVIAQDRLTNKINLIRVAFG